MLTTALDEMATNVARILNAGSNPDLIAIVGTRYFPAMAGGGPAWCEFSANLYDTTFATTAAPNGASYRYVNASSEADLYQRLADAVGVVNPFAAPVVHATPNQRTRIIRLLNHPIIGRPEKTKVLLGINQLSEPAAAAIIADLDARTTAYVEARYHVVGEAFTVSAPAA